MGRGQIMQDPVWPGLILRAMEATGAFQAGEETSFQMSKGLNNNKRKHQAGSKSLPPRSTRVSNVPGPKLEGRAFLTSSPFSRRASTNSSKIDARSLGPTEGPWHFLPSSAFTVGKFMIIFSVFMASG
jgi:hypothetical protein